MQESASAVGHCFLMWILAKCVLYPPRRDPPTKSLATSVTSEILVAYIILDIDGEVDGQRILPLAQGGTLLRQFAIIFL